MVCHNVSRFICLFVCLSSVLLSSPLLSLYSLFHFIPFSFLFFRLYLYTLSFSFSLPSSLPLPFPFSLPSLLLFTPFALSSSLYTSVSLLSPTHSPLPPFSVHFNLSLLSPLSLSLSHPAPHNTPASSLPASPAPLQHLSSTSLAAENPMHCG